MKTVNVKVNGPDQYGSIPIGMSGTSSPTEIGAIICGDAAERSNIMKPKNRLEWFLAKIAGDSDATGSLTPRTRREHYLNEIADNSGGYDLVIELDTISIANASSISATLKKGSYALAMEKVARLEPLSVCVYGADSDDTTGYCAVHWYTVLGVYADINYNDGVYIDIASGNNYSDSLVQIYAASSSGAQTNNKCFAYSAQKKIVLTESGLTIT